MFAGACDPAPGRYTMMTCCEIKSRHNCDQCQAAESTFLQYANLSQRAFSSLVSLANWIAFRDPIHPEVIRNVENLHIGEAHCTQCIVGRLHVRAMVPGAAPAIQDDELFRGKDSTRFRKDCKPASLEAGPMYSEPGICACV